MCAKSLARPKARPPNVRHKKSASRNARIVQALCRKMPKDDSFGKIDCELRKNNVATNGNNLEPEFDALLKAHVKQQANVAVCVQFDPDNATAYLEQAMSKVALATFEEHLSTCAVCRRHLIELSRLMPPPAQVVEPAIVPSTFKERWSEWFSGWRLGALAGLGAVTATVLLLVAVAVNRSDNAASLVALKQPEGQIRQLPEPSAAASSSEEQKHKETPTASGSPVISSPLMTGQDTAPNVPAEPRATNAPEPLARAVNNTAPPPPPAPQPTPAPGKSESERKEAAAPPPATAGAAVASNQANQFRGQTPSGPEANQLQAERALELRKRNDQAAATADAAAPSAPKPAAKSAEAAEMRQGGQQKDALADEVAKKQAPGRTAAAREREKIAERPARPERIIAGKTFRQENGVWIDSDYQADRNFPVVRLTRDSDAYKQTLKDFPALQPYFGLHPVIVVWQGKVYRVGTK